MPPSAPRPWSTQYQEDFNTRKSKGYSASKKKPVDPHRKHNPHPPEGFLDKQKSEVIRDEVRKAFRECMADMEKQKPGSNADASNPGMWRPGHSVPSTMPVMWNPNESVPPPVPVAWNSENNATSHIPPTYMVGHNRDDDAMRAVIEPVMRMIKQAKEKKLRESTYRGSKTPKFNSHGYILSRDDDVPKRPVRTDNQTQKTKETTDKPYPGSRAKSPVKFDQMDKSKNVQNRPLSRAGHCVERPKSSLDRPSDGPDVWNLDTDRNPDILRNKDPDDTDKENEDTGNTDDEEEDIPRVPTPPPREPSPAPPKEPKDYHWFCWPEPDWEEKKNRPHTSLGFNRAPTPMGPGGEDLEDRPDSCQPSYTFGDNEEITKGSPMTFVPDLKSWINSSSDYDMDVAYNMMKHLNRGKSASGRPRSTTMYVNGRPVRPVQRPDPNSGNPYMQAWLPYSYEERRDPYLDLYRSQTARPSVRHRIRYAPSNEYVHENSMFFTTTPRCSGHFVIHPDWVSEKMGLRRSKTTLTKTSRNGLRY